MLTAPWQGTMALAPMDWELSLAAALYVSVSLLRFVLSAFAAIPVGWALGRVPSATGRHWYSFLTGFALLFYPFGWEVLHVVAVSLLTYMVMWAAPKSCGFWGWWINFPYVIALHVLNASGKSWQAGDMDITGAMMITMLKNISIAVCLQDGQSSQKLNGYQEEHKLGTCPTPLEYCSYLLSIGNLLDGPHFEFRPYKDYIERLGLWRDQLPSSVVPVIKAFVTAIISLVIYLWLEQAASYERVFDPWYLNSNLAWKFGFLCLAGFVVRARYYFVWSLSEMSIILSGFGFSGWKDGKNGEREPVWDRCHNVNVLQVEIGDSFSQLLIGWNVCTANFLRRYVYERRTTPGKKPGFRQLVETQLVSGVWHGLYPGYIMVFVAAAFFVSASRVIYKFEQGYPSSFWKSLGWKVIKMVYSSCSLNYICAAFLLLDLDRTIRAWGQVYYIPFLIALPLCLLSTVAPPPKPKKRQE